MLLGPQSPPINANIGQCSSFFPIIRQMSIWVRVIGTFVAMPEESAFLRYVTLFELFF